MSMNICVFSGNLGRDCEQRYTPNGKCVASFSLPVKQGYGEHEKTTWVTCRMFGGMAEKLPQHLTKGLKVTVNGEFLIEEWINKEGQKVQTPVVIVNNIDFNSLKQSNQQQNNAIDFDEAIPF